jgi:hypothetical protein
MPQNGVFGFSSPPTEYQLPNQQNLRFWLRARDIGVSTGSRIPFIPNFGAPGGYFTQDAVLLKQDSDKRPYVEITTSNTVYFKGNIESIPNFTLFLIYRNKGGVAWGNIINHKTTPRGFEIVGGSNSTTTHYPLVQTVNGTTEIERYMMPAVGNGELVGQFIQYSSTPSFRFTTTGRSMSGELSSTGYIGSTTPCFCRGYASWNIDLYEFLLWDVALSEKDFNLASSFVWNKFLNQNELV